MHLMKEVLESYHFVKKKWSSGEHSKEGAEWSLHHEEAARKKAEANAKRENIIMAAKEHQTRRQLHQKQFCNTCDTCLLTPGSHTSINCRIFQMETKFALSTVSTQICDV